MRFAIDNNSRPADMSWHDAPDWSAEYCATTDPRVFAVIMRDTYPTAPYGDACAPAYYVTYRNGWHVERAGDTYHDAESDEIAERIASAYEPLDWEGAARYARIFHNSVFVTLDTSDGYLLIIDTPSFREHINRPLDVRPWAGYDARYPLGGVGFDAAEWLSVDMSDWHAYLSGEVYGVGYAVMPGRVIDDGVMPDWDTLANSVEMTCWGFYGADHASDAAASGDYDAPALPLMLDIDMLDA